MPTDEFIRTTARDKMAMTSKPARWPTVGRAATFLVMQVCVLALAMPSGAQDAAAERLFREAERQSLDDSAAALAGFELLVEQFPRDALAPRALLRVAEIRHDLGDGMKSDIAIDRLIDDYGRSAEAAAGFLLRGTIQLRAARNAEGLETARGTLRRVPLLFDAASYPDLAARGEARLLEGRISRLLGDRDSASAAFVALLEDEPSTAAAAMARFELAHVLLDGAYWQAAVELLQRSITLDPEGAKAERNLLALIHRRILRPQAGQRWFGAARHLAIEGLGGPSGVGAADDGRLLVVDPSDATVAALAPEGNVLGRATVKNATGPWWDAGRATVSIGDRYLQPFAGTAAGSKTVGRLAEVGKGDGFLKGILGSARGALGDLFVAARGEKGLLRYASPRRAAVLLEQGKRQIVDVAEARGTVYALDRDHGEVWRVGIDRVPEPNPFVRGEWKRAAALAVDDLGTLFVLDRGPRTIDVFDADRNRVTTLGPTLPGGIELRAPSDIAVDAAGRLFIADPKLPHLVVLE